MNTSIKSQSINYLQSLIGKTLSYAIKSPDTELYDFGFIDLTKIPNSSKINKVVNTQILHILCRFRVIWRTGEKRIDEYYEDTCSKKFDCDIKRLVGLSVKRISLSEKNDLWLDFDDCWVVFATHENGEESWRFFTLNLDDPHLVVSNCLIEFVYRTQENNTKIGDASLS